MPTAHSDWPEQPPDTSQTFTPHQSQVLSFHKKPAKMPTPQNQTPRAIATQTPTNKNETPMQNTTPITITAQTKKGQPSTVASWAERVKITSSSTRFTLEPIPRQNQRSTLKIPTDIVMERTDQWQRCLVGFFPGFRMSYHTINTIANRVWKKEGLENVMTTANGFILFRFQNEDQIRSVLEQGPWMFGGKHLILQQWHPRFQFDPNKIAKLPVWVRLKGLPLPLWSVKGLSLAASMVGEPLSCDQQTHACTKLEYARVCVEIDASLPYVHSFEIESILSPEPIQVTVEYEWKPVRCSKCSVFGHSCTPVATSNEADTNHTAATIATNPTSQHTASSQNPTPQLNPPAKTPKPKQTAGPSHVSTVLADTSETCSPNPPKIDLDNPRATLAVQPPPPQNSIQTKTGQDVSHGTSVSAGKKVVSFQSQSPTSEEDEDDDISSNAPPIKEKLTVPPMKTGSQKKGGKKRKEAKGF
ncbi:hypothetical protein DKX38_020240 [Salix brachista]|uniref:DUF4283 domain-containing protein n=1 Tax=Salix brachista TaxID=2182728 RepID=A0A5N5KIH3_9ROSI|nr:hypothetical protein DKX38_020240 [Salix brachista]